MEVVTLGYSGEGISFPRSVLVLFVTVVTACCNLAAGHCHAAVTCMQQHTCFLTQAYGLQRSFLYLHSLIGLWHHWPLVSVVLLLFIRCLT